MQIKLLSLLLLFAAAPASFVFAQQPQMEISGRVKDLQSQQPLRGVSITINRSGTGTITNSMGDFRLQVPANALHDTLRISSLGYKVQYLPIVVNREMNITLEPVSLVLKEVAVVMKDPVKLLKEAIRKIPDNYINKPHQLRGFYRINTTRGEDYMQLSEAVFDIFNHGYGEKAGNELYLIRMRYVKDEAASHGLDLGLKPDYLFDYDMVKEIKNSKILSEEGLKNHLFAIEGIVDYKGAPAYEITFDQRAGVKKSLYKGKLYLDKETLTFLKIERELSPRGLSYASYGDLASKTLMSLLDIHINPRKDVLSVEYQKVGERWVLSDVVSNTLLNFYSKKRQYNFTADIKVNYIVTAVDTTKEQAVSIGKRLGDGKVIENQTTPLEPDFWRHNTMLLPDFDAEAVAAILKTRNENGRLQKQIRGKIQQMPHDPPARIDSILSYYHLNNQFNGTALVKNKNGIILSKSYGYADKEQKLPADSNTQYRIGSLSKSFTAIVILQLMQQGKLQLKDSVKKFLPDYVHGDVTIEQLLTHQSGIPNYTNNPDYLSKIMHQSFSLKELVAKFCSDSLEFLPGTQFQYSNSGYVLLACLAEGIFGKPFVKVLKENIFLPAGMQHTYAGIDTTSDNRMATGYLYETKEPLYFTANTLGAGGIVSTAADLQKWSAALSSNKLLSKETMTAMYQPRVAYSDWDAFYGYGWMIDQRRFALSAAQHKIIYHPGTDIGFYTMFVKQEDNDGVIILLNNTGDFPRFDLTDMILTEMNADR
ncbi:serine hydrolase [Chitinophaga sp. RAB17]|uniref:serine hydrolase n=1 Tax=Chitinophaga sp. RAB17 TaxID=3233049 RepID=UPI003F911864